MPCVRSQTTLDGLTNRLPGAGVSDEPASFPRGLLMVGNSDSLCHLTTATPISLHSSYASSRDIAQKGHVISTAELCTGFHLSLKSLPSLHKAQPSLQTGLCPRITSLKMEPGIRPTLLGDILFSLQYFGGQKALKFLSSPCSPPRQPPAVMNKRGRLRE